MVFHCRLFWRMTLRSVFRTAGTHAPLNRKRAGFLVFYYIVWTSLAIAAWIGMLLDEILFRAYRRQPVDKPLFILSNHRSGSTFLLRTLAKDAATFSSTKAADIYLMPSVFQRKAFALFARMDRLIGSRGERALRKLDARLLGKVKIHPISMFDAEEDEDLLILAWRSFLLCFPFPFLEEMPPYQYFDTAIPHAERRRIMGFYRALVQRHMYAQRHMLSCGARHYLSKNPLFSAKIESLLETFPNARIVYLVRNPLEMVPSTVSLFGYAWQYFADPPEPYPRRDEILAWARYWYDHPLEVIDRDTTGRCMIVKYDDLVRQPDRIMREIYTQFGYEQSPALDALLQQAAASAKTYRSDHRYSLDQLGLSRERIVSEFAHIFERFGFSTGIEEGRNSDGMEEPEAALLTVPSMP